jgi:Tol biopolymer transport system component
MNAQYSPDGSKIAFTGSNYKGIYIYNTADGSIKQLTNEDAAGYGYSWSSNSSYILTRVAKFEDTKRYNAVKLFDINAGTSKLMTEYRTLMPGMPAFANGDSKVIICNRGMLEVFETGIDKKANATDNLIYVKDNKIAIGSLANKSVNMIEPEKDGRVLNLTVSPDGNKAAFEVIGGSMYVINTDGSNMVNLGAGFRPKFSPDGNKIVYQITEDNGHDFTSSNIYVINTDGSGKQKLTDRSDVLSMHPSFAPDGNSIIFNSLKDGVIYSMQISK